MRVMSAIFVMESQCNAIEIAPTVSEPPADKVASRRFISLYCGRTKLAPTDPSAQGAGRAAGTHPFALAAFSPFSVDLWITCTLEKNLDPHANS
jgi:hypothetical protein